MVKIQICKILEKNYSKHSKKVQTKSGTIYTGKNDGSGKSNSYQQTTTLSLNYDNLTIWSYPLSSVSI